jgi:hypothetical protein
MPLVTRQILSESSYPYLEKINSSVKFSCHIRNHFRILHKTQEAPNAILALLRFDPLDNTLQDPNTQSCIGSLASLI